MDATTIQTIPQLIGSLGFPIVVAGWLLIKGSRDSQNLQDAINAQKESTQAAIAAQTATLEKLATAVDMLSRTQQK